jgi:hypothetical protein
MSRWVDDKGSLQTWPVVRDVCAVALAALAAVMAGCPAYNVWHAGMSGQAELRRAEQNRQIAVLESHAKMDSAKLLAEAEVERARGVAAANKIIGDSLKGNEAYLRYLWIHNLDSPNIKVVYIPTEAGLPILEAGKRVEPPAPAPR